MPNATIEFIANIFAGAVEQAYEPKLVALLQKLHDQNVDLYMSALHGFNAGIKALQPLVTQTPTHIDDGLIVALNDVVTQSAAANGVDLNQTPTA